MPQVQPPAFGNLPYVYGFNENMFIIANTNTGDIQSYIIQYCKTPVNTDEFSSKIDDFLSGWLPDLSMYKERYLIAAVSDGNNSKFGVYRMDGEIWLAELRGIEIWSIYRLKKTETTKLDDLEHIIEVYEKNSLPSPLSESQMTIKDIYTLARKGSELMLNNFKPFSYQLSGSDFTMRRYDAADANTVFVHTEEGLLEFALLMSHRTLNPPYVIDLREGFEAVTKYMNPLKSFKNISMIPIDNPLGGEFAVLHHLFTFPLNNEVFYPSN